MISLKMDTKEAKEATEPASIDPPKYPWWARISFDDDWAEKLGLDKYELGDECVITLRGKICGKDKSERIDTDKDGDEEKLTVCFQGEEADAEPVTDPKEEHYKKLY